MFLFILHRAAANLQTNGIPHQFQQCHTGLGAALDFYTDNYPHNVKKWVLDVPAGSDVPAASEVPAGSDVPAGSEVPARSEWVSVPESTSGSGS
jgi:predicted nicotinamide N-methyase